MQRGRKEGKKTWPLQRLASVVNYATDYSYTSFLSAIYCTIASALINFSASASGISKPAEETQDSTILFKHHHFHFLLKVALEHTTKTVGIVLTGPMNTPVLK